jgi:hypothetical protein
MIMRITGNQGGCGNHLDFNKVRQDKLERTRGLLSFVSIAIDLREQEPFAHL